MSLRLLSRSVISFYKWVVVPLIIFLLGPCWFFFFVLSLRGVCLVLYLLVVVVNKNIITIWFSIFLNCLCSFSSVYKFWLWLNGLIAMEKWTCLNFYSQNTFLQYEGNKKIYIEICVLNIHGQMVGGGRGVVSRALNLKGHTWTRARANFAGSLTGLCDQDIRIESYSQRDWNRSNKL